MHVRRNGVSHITLIVKSNMSLANHLPQCLVRRVPAWRKCLQQIHVPLFWLQAPMGGGGLIKMCSDLVSGSSDR